MQAHLDAEAELKHKKEEQDKAEDDANEVNRIDLRCSEALRQKKSIEKRQRTLPNKRVRQRGGPRWSRE